MSEPRSEIQPPLDFAHPMRLRAEMARAGIAPMHVYGYEDPERGWIDPLDDDEARTTVRWFMGEVWRACLRAEQAVHPGSSGGPDA